MINKRNFLTLLGLAPAAAIAKESDIRFSQPADGWQPIETAPRNGKNILIYSNKKIISASKTPLDIWGTDGRWVGMMAWNPIGNGEYGWATPTGYPVEPTHWMTLPEPPKGD